MVFKSLLLRKMQSPNKGLNCSHQKCKSAEETIVIFIDRTTYDKWGSRRNINWYNIKINVHFILERIRVINETNECGSRFAKRYAKTWTKDTSILQRLYRKSLRTATRKRREGLLGHWMMHSALLTLMIEGEVRSRKYRARQIIK